MEKRRESRELLVLIAFPHCMGVASRARRNPHNQLSVAITPPWATAQRHRRSKRERYRILHRAGRQHAENRIEFVVHAHANRPLGLRNGYARCTREKDERGWKGTKKSSAKKDGKSDRLLPGRAQARASLFTSALRRPARCFEVARYRRHVVQ